MATQFPYLLELLQEASSGLPSVMPKRMFGCDALFAGGKIYALVWKTGRLGVRLPDPVLYAEALALEGSEPWKAGEMVMSHWVLLPEAFHDEPEGLRPWVLKAHAAAMSGPGPAGKKKKVSAGKATGSAAKKRVSAAKSSVKRGKKAGGPAGASSRRR